MFFKHLSWKRSLLSFSLLVLFTAFSQVAFAAPADHYVITVNTALPGTSDSQSFTIPTFPGLTYNYSVDTNNDTDFVDLEDFQLQTGDLTIDFGAPGIYTIRIDGTFPAIFFNNGGDAQKLVSVDQWGTISWESFVNAYYGASNFNILAADNPDLSGVTSLAGTFRGASSLDADLSGWDTTTITNLQFSFRDASSFDGNITTWDVSNVTTMFGTFLGATAFNQNLNSWITTSLENLTWTFQEAENFNQPLNNWDVSNVTTLSETFLRAYDFDQDLNNWETSLVTDMGGTFREATVFNGNIGTWDTSSATDMAQMFLQADAFNQSLTNWETGAVLDMNTMFFGTDLFDGDITTWDVSSVTTMDSMFEGALAFNQDLSGWDTSDVTLMGGMFDGATSFNQPIGTWATEQVTAMNNMFNGATDFDQDLGEWNTNSLSSAIGMFAGVELSQSNYDSLLAGWSQHRADNVTFDAGNSTYCDETSRAILTDDKGWTITDGGLAPDCTAVNTGGNTSNGSSSSGGGSAASPFTGDNTSSSEEPTLDPEIEAINEKLNNLPIQRCLIEDSSRNAEFTDGSELPSSLEILTRLKASQENNTYLLQGNGDGSLALDRVLNRVEAVKLILVSHCLPILNEEKIPDTTFTGKRLPAFTDLPKGFGTPTDKWVRDVFYSAAYYEIIKGTGDGTAEAARKVNAAEFYTMLARMMNLTNLASLSPTNVESATDTWYEESVGKLITETLLQSESLASFNYSMEIDRLTALELIAKAIQTRNMMQ